MHLDNLLPLLRLWPLFALLLGGLAGYLWVAGGRLRRDARRHSEQERRYRIAELAYRGRMWVKDWLSRTRTPRLTYQGPPLDPDRGRPGRRRRK
jgi:hypothetical protein